MGRIASSRPHEDDLSRRTVLGGLAAAAMLPGGAYAAGDDISPVMRKLAGYMAEAGGRALPDKVAREAKYHILDTLAAMISGSELPPGQHALAFARAFGGQPKVTVVASDILAGPLEAAIVNGAFAQADETDDNYSAGGAHPGCAIVPASLAVGELLGIDGLRFVRAVTLGYDVGMRAMKAVYRDNVLRDTHNIVGTFGASAAAGAIAGLDEQRMRWLLDYAAQQAGSGFGAWQRDTEHTEKAFLFGSAAARNGVTAALLIKTGWTGVDDVFSGHENFFQTYAPKSDPATLVDKLGERFEVTQTIIKKWSTGGPIQSPLDAVVNLRKEHPFTADDVKANHRAPLDQRRAQGRQRRRPGPLPAIPRRGAPPRRHGVVQGRPRQGAHGGAGHSGPAPQGARRRRRRSSNACCRAASPSSRSRSPTAPCSRRRTTPCAARRKIR